MEPNHSRPLEAPVYLCGPIAEFGQPAKGGYQSANLRLMQALAQRGIKVHTLAYAQPNPPQIRKIMKHVTRFTVLTLRLVTCERNAILHITALRLMFLYPELVLMYLAKFRNCRIIYDMRDGLTADVAQLAKSAWYTRCFTHALKIADLVMVEGQPQVRFVETLSARTPIVIPNHIDVASIPLRSPKAGNRDTPIIAYAGTLKPEKGISTILQTARILKGEGLEIRVRVAGTGEADYLEELRVRYADIGVDWRGSQTAEAVLEMFSESHFFIFPSKWRGEGQSNALTEAMACGCVPIVSDQGFNAATVGGCGVVLPSDAEPHDYSSAVQQIWRNGHWEKLSQCAIKRVRREFSTSLVVDRIASRYSELVGEQRVD